MSTKSVMKPQRLLLSLICWWIVLRNVLAADDGCGAYTFKEFTSMASCSDGSQVKYQPAALSSTEVSPNNITIICVQNPGINVGNVIQINGNCYRVAYANDEEVGIKDLQGNNYNFMSILYDNSTVYMGTYSVGGKQSCVINAELTENTAVQGTASPISYYAFNVAYLNAPLEITFESDDDSKAMVSVAFNECPTFMAEELLSSQETTTSFYKHARLQLSTASHPSLQQGEWFIGIHLASNSSKPFTVRAAYGTSYNNYWVPTLLLFALFPLVLGYVALVMWLLLRKGVLPAIPKMSEIFHQSYKHYYYHNLLILCIFVVPLFQAVLALESAFNLATDRSQCMYNTFCQKPLGSIPSFNSIWSNVAYLFAGTSLLLYTSFLRVQIHGCLVQAVSVALIAEGLLNAVYEACPLSLIFQFDTAFIFVVIGIYALEMLRKSSYSELPPDPRWPMLIVAMIIFLNWIGSLIGKTPRTDIARNWTYVFLLVASILGVTFLLYHFRLRRLYPEQDWASKKNMVKYIIIGFLVVAIPLWVLTLVLQNLYIGVLCTMIILLLMISVIGCIRVGRKSDSKGRVSKGRFICVVLMLLLGLAVAVGGVAYIQATSYHNQLAHDPNRVYSECIAGDFYGAHDMWSILGAAGVMLFSIGMTHFESVINADRLPNHSTVPRK